MVSSNNNNNSTTNITKRDHYYTEVGIKISQFKISVRFPIISTKLGSSSNSKDADNEWKWVPQRTDYHSTSTLESVSWCPNGSESQHPAPPVPPRSGSPTNPPPSALPPYPSSTVTRRRKPAVESESRRSRRVCSYV